jgi:Uma2 family endonuclease
MSTPAILQETRGALEVATWTVDQYESLVRTGILPDGAPFELIDGLVVLKDRAAEGEAPMTVGTAHQLCVQKILRLAPRIEERGCFLQAQGPIRIPAENEPEPDIAVVRGKAEDFAKRHPAPRDVESLIEVADSSLERDRTTKLRIYAAAGIRQYIIVNLVDEIIELYYGPQLKERRYASGVKKVPRGREVGIVVGPSRAYVKVDASEFLP